MSREWTDEMEEEAAGGPPPIGSNSGDFDLDGMDMEDLKKEGERELLKDLVLRVKAGMATPPEKATLLQMLRAYGMHFMGDPLDDGHKPKNNDKTELPRFDKPEYGG